MNYEARDTDRERESDRKRLLYGFLLWVQLWWISRQESRKGFSPFPPQHLWMVLFLDFTWPWTVQRTHVTASCRNVFGVNTFTAARLSPVTVTLLSLSSYHSLASPQPGGVSPKTPFMDVNFALRWLWLRASHINCVGNGAKNFPRSSLLDAAGLLTRGNVS